MRAIRRALKVIGVNVLICLALLVPIELIFGDWLTEDTDLSMLNVRPNTIDVEPSPVYPAGRMITYSRDKYGFRGGAGDASRIDVLAVGGSTTNERYVDDSDTWAVRLQRLLGERNCPLTIANAGVDGYSTIGHIASFDQWFDRVPGLKPRIVLVYAGINDALLNPSAMPADDRRKYGSWWREAEHYVAAHSAVRRLYVTLRGWWRAREGHVLHGEVPVTKDTAWEPASLPADFAAQAARRTAPYRDRLQRLNQLIHGFRATPVYITQVRVDGRETDGRWQQVAGSRGAFDTAMLLAIDRATLDFCRDTAETCIDLAGRIHFEPADHYDAVHTTPSGSTRTAAFLAPELSPILCKSAARE
jgi:lysophospholipase L1-like esterase